MCTLLRRELKQRGIDRSVHGILQDLGNIREVGVVFAPEGKKRKPILKTTLSSMSEPQRALYDALDLDRYRSA